MIHWWQFSGNSGSWMYKVAHAPSALRWCGAQYLRHRTALFKLVLRSHSIGGMTGFDPTSLCHAELRGASSVIIDNLWG